jgi:hypothetical protein
LVFSAVGPTFGVFGSALIDVRPYGNRPGMLARVTADDVLAGAAASHGKQVRL